MISFYVKMTILLIQIINMLNFSRLQKIYGKEGETMNKKNTYSEITQEIIELTELCERNSTINPELYERYDVKRGLRDINGKGVLTGLTEISEIQAFRREGDQLIPAEGKLYYRALILSRLYRGS